MTIFIIKLKCILLKFLHFRGRHGHDHMVVGFTTTYVNSAYQH